MSLYANDGDQSNFRAVAALIARLPDDAYVSSAKRDYLSLIVMTIADVRAVRRSFPGTTWAKKFQPDQNWWLYSTEIDGVKIELFGCSDAPAGCKVVSETYEVEEQVATVFETRVVTKTRLRSECGEPAAV